MTHTPDPGDAIAGDMINQPDEKLGIRTYTTTSPILVKAVQLTEDADADWEAIATWCGGQVHTERNIMVQRDKYDTALVIPGIATAVMNDWVIQGVTGSFFVRSPEEFAATYTPAECCPDCERPGPHNPIPGKPGMVECHTCSASWDLDLASAPRVFRPGDPEPGQAVTVVIGQDRHGGRDHLWRRHGIPGLTPTGWVSAEAVIEWSRIFDFHPHLVEVRLPDFTAAVAADEQAIAAGQQVTR